MRVVSGHPSQRNRVGGRHPDHRRIRFINAGESRGGSQRRYPDLSSERVDQSRVGTDDVHVVVNTTTERTEALPELSSGKAVVNEQVSVQVVDAPATTVVLITEGNITHGAKKGNNGVDGLVDSNGMAGH